VARLPLTVRGRSHRWPWSAGATAVNAVRFPGGRRPHPAADHRDRGSADGDAGHPPPGRSRSLLQAFALLVVLPPGLAAAQPANSAIDGATPDTQVSVDARSRQAAWAEGVRRAAEALVWSDERIAHEWRIQRRPGTDDCRLLDPRDRVVIAGPRAACDERFAELVATGLIPRHTGPTVIVLHGLGEGRSSMSPLVEHLRRNVTDTVVTFGYASPRAGLADHGAALASVVAALPAGEGVSFVAHSLGNLVVRRWMHSAAPAELARVRRIVMLGAPNQGSELARLASRVWGLPALTEGAARELVVDWERIAPDLAVPTCPFGIVAGGRGDESGFSALLEGDDDAVVRVAETRLEGADDFLLVPVHHALMMRHPTVQRATVSFLTTGRFEATDGTASEPVSR